MEAFKHQKKLLEDPSLSRFFEDYDDTPRSPCGVHNVDSLDMDMMVNRLTSKTMKSTQLQNKSEKEAFLKTVDSVENLAEDDDYFFFFWWS
mmetsp:Transcript_21386/g.29623  ORF Transcript_21386/g.29623 Transcript_21386/m.29623 type:complete len:91 (-) Transcript_21386:145-417(-)